YRLRVLERAEIYHHPLDDEARNNLVYSFEHFTGTWQSDQPIRIENRDIETIRLAEGIAWFDFTAICDGPRSQTDYIELARLFHTVLVSDIPQLDEAKENPVRRLISLVDEFYDRSVKLMLSAAVPLNQLYRGKRLKFEFERTQSRLLEMQSHDYLAREHRP
ncbi:MAG: cell division protein ZapE, partial [Gammaproteobacteria bacterium]